VPLTTAEKTILLIGRPSCSQPSDRASVSFGILFLYRKLIFSIAEFSYWGAAGICILVLIAGLVAAHLIDARR
jgi:hypothetical protein